MSSLVTIDGSAGEGGGQILRSALALSLATGRPFRIEHIRAGRRKPGLLRQHLTAVQAAARIGCAHVEGDTLGSGALAFTPQALQAGVHHFQVGTAGSTALVVQAVLPALLHADGPSELVVEGGTHARSAPPFEFLVHAYAPLIERIGGRIEATLERPGYYPSGGGRIRVRVTPGAPAALELRERGRRTAVEAVALFSQIPAHVAQRELNVVNKRLGWPAKSLRVQERDAVGPGNALILRVQHEHVSEVFVAFAALGVTAERVARAACAEAKRYLSSDVPVGTYLADQLMLPLALGAGGVYRTFPLSPHGQTNIEVIGMFLDGPIQVHPVDNRVVDVRVPGRV